MFVMLVILFNKTSIIGIINRVAGPNLISYERNHPDNTRTYDLCAEMVKRAYPPFTPDASTVSF